MNSQSDLYKILESDKKATKEEIRMQYKKLALKYHPDNKDHGNDKKFMEVNEAYEILVDPDRKKIYDKYGMDGLKQCQYEPPQMEGEKKRCKNRIHFLHVELEDVYKGSRITFQFIRKGLCAMCDGTGTDNPAARLKCKKCNGAGETLVSQRMGNIMVQNSMDCDDCEGTGWEKNQFICEDCNGKRVAYETVEKTVELERGCPDGYRFTFYGEGDRKYNVEDGDLFVDVMIKKHKLFRREGADIWYRLDLTLLEAITGFNKIIPSINIEERLEINSSDPIQNGEIRVLQAKGMPFFNAPHKFGNMMLEVYVVFPNSFDEKMYKKLSGLKDLLNINKVETEDEKLELEKIESHNKEIYYMSDYRLDETNPSVTGGKTSSEDTSKILFI